MKRLLVLTVLAAALASLAAPLHAQDEAPARPTPTTIDEVIGAVYATISGPAGERDWAFFRTLFVENARFMSIRAAQDGSTTAADMTIDGYIERAGGFFMQNAFFEKEVSRVTEEFGAVAHCFSTYASYRDPEGEPFSRGVNSIQLVNVGDGWKVVSIVWDSERPGLAIPERYLP